MRPHSHQNRGAWSVSRFRPVHGLWLIVFIACTVLLALNSGRHSSSHHSRLLTQLENFEQSAGRLLLRSAGASTSSPPPAPPPEVDLALRSRARFAEQLGLRMTDSAAESPFPEPPNGSARRVLQSAMWRPKLLRQCTEGESAAGAMPARTGGRGGGGCKYQPKLKQNQRKRAEYRQRR